jgi:DUF1016 N-terminal domain
MRAESVTSRNLLTEMSKSELLPNSYSVLLQEVKRRIRESQLRASASVNRELVLLYWRIGRDILVRQQSEQWGAKVIDRLAESLPRNEGLLHQELLIHPRVCRGLAG